MKLDIYTAKTSKILVTLGIILIILTLILFVWKEPLLDLKSPISKINFGLFGDFISGVVGSIWALAGVILFYVALTEQRKDFKTNKEALEKQTEALNLQLLEFQNQRYELEHARRISVEQYKTLKRQQFESTFFSLIQLKSDITSRLPKDGNGGDYFTWKKNELEKDSNDIDTPEEMHIKTKELYLKFYFANKQELSHYYKSIYRVLKFIENSDFEEKEKQFYAKVLRSQFTENELFLLYYNSLTTYGQNLRRLILHYNFLKHLPPISKLEFKEFSLLENIDICANRLSYCDFIQKLLEEFINQMKENRMSILNGSLQEVSIPFNENGVSAIFEVCADSLTHLNFTVHFRDEENFILNFLGLDDNRYLIFQKKLFYDLFRFSRYKNSALDIVLRESPQGKSFSINSTDGFEISFDKY